MKFRTDVSITKPSWGIRHSDKLLLLGSCFADNMGERLERAGFTSMVNPFGTLYNPASIAEVLTRLLDERLFSPEEMQPFGAEGWGSWVSHSLLSCPTKEQALELLNQRFKEAGQQLRRTDVLILTFGSAWVYRLMETDEIVANCHHEPSSRFVRERLEVNDIVALWRPLMERLHALNPAMHILFTVSPIRHLRDGAHANQLSKATLLLAMEALTASDKETAYFPAYEIMLDELRDYRFYADDMIHPSSMAIDYLWERFGDTFFDASTRVAAARIEEVTKAVGHRPLHPDSEDYRRFIRQTLLKIEDIQKEFPYFDAENLIDQCHTLLNN